MTDISDPQEEEEIFAFKYGADWPEAISQMGSIMLGGRPVNQGLGPMQQHKILIAASPYRAPTPRRAGKGKPLPASDHEGEQETTQRKNTQKQIMRLILPKTSVENADTFLRRLDAHKNAPEALVAPMSSSEDETAFAKRCMAVKETAETPDHFILPKGPKENAQEFDERLAVAKKSPTIVFPRGAHETYNHFKARLQVAKTAKRAVMPKSKDEPEIGFTKRVDMQIACEYVVHPYDPAREDEHLYTRRLQACKEKTALNFEPGDKRAIVAAIGEEHVHKELPAAAPPAAAPTAAEVAAEAIAAEEAAREKEAAELAKADEAKKAEEAAKASDEDKVAQRIAEMKLKQEEERRLKEETERKASFQMEQVEIGSVGFMPLKKLLQERGVPKEQVFACANKFALIEVAKKWGPELKIEFIA